MPVTYGRFMEGLRQPWRPSVSGIGSLAVGSRQLKELFQASNRDLHRIIGRLADDGIQWKFNPPAAPHFGGLWEAAVKALKHHLRRVIGETRLTYEEMATFLAEVESCLNSRPLQALSDDPEDLSALTPGHFLIGGALNALPEPSLLDVPANRLSRWQLLQQMRDHLWQRWSREYVQGLAPRPKWWATPGNLKDGQLCLVKTETTPPCRWPLARIIRLHPGEDGHIRVVDVRTSGGELTRPVVKIVPLPSANAEQPEPSA
ncbi:bel12-ag transposon polyprotein [Lasius niger]|uniref:Bel12-ag transposon polyprotein n=1 Tax=Lasius niger TaxID=67767 RepID=A0A0J7K9I1_LASNI|nr:bel12-ag transposon polyprotein [Lasius niger]